MRQYDRNRGEGRHGCKKQQFRKHRAGCVGTGRERSMGMEVIMEDDERPKKEE